MSWMDSWSRPTKNQATPAPFYLLPGGEETPYCRCCGRVISTRKSQATKTSTTPARYCSSRCRSHRPGKLDGAIEAAFVRFLTREEAVPGDAKQNTKTKARSKGETRVLVPCQVVQDHIFDARQPHGHEDDASVEEGSGDAETDSDDEETSVGEQGGTSTALDGHVLARMAVRSGTRVRPAQSVSEVNGSVGGEKGRAERMHESDEMKRRRADGQRKAREREMVRCAARRGVAFGFPVAGGERKKCEAVMQGKVVEPSFAKGEWGVRWRE